ncbi:MAG: K(+)-insensitive pyrophosphate-energized proton pump [Candidatus Nomurabacteria bacterium GW2011_GWE1_32_28]|uniref:K(+)-insensitive pyrophosphate-energized proton pump n=1 Tax=Candidatus Nomurabacteria bacterium GW2011_GWF1_31_48 TaxID=1618767 RepID=A0A0F9YFM7_9BACT|nr:MAG: K(+)-insensitive pyrophosphate-energized proton pump [Candidatus Nomurabacteria bacterium GW2011_GWF2_30_133]KKP29056.1 MAG: K(+)-insensitive pyrophosphate-energized proton pump [Candidatus Nomurabacteria bacterium GW2011_GWE2_31_40]KKP30534.1 MAG: K(+)-insensitive pyrophosphate-energized proton pump [Candidatus Nomurabacteria bacterium GW2011_GWF1_31_48]KKP35019.1 MAG: K(+)-insensitive pyrophosphate-energized proton pump [Candidatus Nomurabacteria bacterium GW2011_GWE1_32_28]HAS80615.1
MKVLLLLLFSSVNLLGQEIDLKIPDMSTAYFGFANGWQILMAGTLVIIVTLSFSLFMSWKIKTKSAHYSMLQVSEIIYQTCKTYLVSQAKFLMTLFAFTMIIIVIYLSQMPSGRFSFFASVGYVFVFSLLGMIGSYLVAWYGIRLNTWANSRTAFLSLKGKPWEIVNLPLQSGMAIGLFLISLELIMMVIILLAVPRELATYSFLGFAIGESLCASVLRLAGGIFTKIADIGADLMKIIFKVKEDDPRNPATIADCTGDNAGDSIGPTADFFESYGVTGVALITFFLLAVPDSMLQAKLIVWIFSMRFIMDVSSGISYFINQKISEKKYANLTEFDFEEPLTRLIRIAAFGCIMISFIVSYILLSHLGNGYWYQLASIISLGTLSALLIPELTKVFTSPKSVYVGEIVKSGREGGSALVVLSGIVTGNFSAFWQGMTMLLIMFLGFVIGKFSGLENLIPHIDVGSLGLIAFGMLCMGPVNIATDSYGPVSDNSQSIYELSQIEKLPNIREEIKRNFGFTPNFEKAKELLERNDACGNTFKATVKPVLIGTAVSGATIMVFSIMLLLEKVGMLNLSLSEPPVLFGLIAGSAFVFWFAGASTQAVTAGAYKATAFVKKNFSFNVEKASVEDSKKVVEICTTYAQKGALNIFWVLISITIGFSLIDPNFFISYLIAVSVVGLFMAIYMANAGGAWDNAKKVVEVDLKLSNTPLHEATIVGDTVGDPFKDTSSVALNPIIKFSSLFGLLGIELAVKFAVTKDGITSYTYFHFIAAAVLLTVALVFVWRSFYTMRMD